MGSPALVRVIIIIIILLQECDSFYSWSPADVSRTQGSAGFCSLVAIFYDLVLPTFANLCNHVLFQHFFPSLFRSSFFGIIFLHFSASSRMTNKYIWLMNNYNYSFASKFFFVQMRVPDRVHERRDLRR